MTQPCDIKAQTKLRNGYLNWWCYTHFAPARGEGGIKLGKCSKADLPPLAENEVIKVDLDDYAGGVGIWGALEAVYDTKRDEPEHGVHVHLRRHPDDEKKEVDASFKEVYIKLPPAQLHDEGWLTIDEYTACAYTASVVLGRKIKVINCKHCNRAHIDADWFAVHYHRKHFCTYCGRDFIDSERGISNPVVLLQTHFKEKMDRRILKKSERALNIQQSDYPGGLQIWGSNPAIIWTADRAEEAGIHVHLFADKNSPPTIDETFGRVVIDGIELDDEMIRYYMVQRSFSFLEKFIVGLDCPNCNKEHFDKGDLAVTPHKIHTCEHCGSEFSDNTRYKGVVSNPIITKLALLKANLNANGNNSDQR